MSSKEIENLIASYELLRNLVKAVQAMDYKKRKWEITRTSQDRKENREVAQIKGVEEREEIATHSFAGETQLPLKASNSMNRTLYMKKKQTCIRERRNFSEF